MYKKEDLIRKTKKVYNLILSINQNIKLAYDSCGEIIEKKFNKNKPVFIYFLLVETKYPYIRIWKTNDLKNTLMFAYECSPYETNYIAIFPENEILDLEKCFKLFGKGEGKNKSWYRPTSFIWEVAELIMNREFGKVLELKKVNNK